MSQNLSARLQKQAERWPINITQGLFFIGASASRLSVSQVRPVGVPDGQNNAPS